MVETTTPDQITVLKGRTPIAHGAVRDIWDRPNHSDQILKTIRADKQLKYANRSALRHSIDHLRLGPYGTFKLEYRSYLNTAYKCALLQLPIPIAEVGGLVMTDLGLAQINEKITCPTGNIAQTLHSLLCKNQLDKERLGWLNDFIHSLFVLNVNAPDLRARNIVIDEDKKRFVLIDGYGDKTILPLRAWIKPLNQRNLEAQFLTYEQYGNVRWDTHTKSFSVIGETSH